MNQMYWLILILALWSLSLEVRGQSEECGLKIDDINHAFSGSEDPTFAPWVVSIGNSVPTFVHTCTGSIIKDNVVITAAHCVKDEKFDRDTYRVIAGILDLRFAGTVERKILKTEIHPEYKNPIVYNDVALLFLDQPFEFSSRISSICLPSSGDEFQLDTMDGLGVTVQGWGKNDEGTIGETLTQIDVNIRSNEECNYLYNNTVRRGDWIRVQTFLPDLLTDNMFCASSNFRDNVGTCHGDSGGPAFVRKFKNGLYRYTLIGVVGGNLHCASRYPDFYCFVGNEMILSWITLTMRTGGRISGSETNEDPISTTDGGSWVCSIKTTRWGHICGASLITETMLLTAASCVVNNVGGEAEMSIECGSSNKQTRKVLKIRLNPSYRRSNIHIEHDLALLITDRDFTLTRDVTTISLAGPPTKTLRPCYAFGWGGEVDGAVKNISLSTSLISRSCLNELRSILNKDDFNLNIDDTSEFCVLNEFCAGDGGAPVVCSYDGDNDENFVLEGVNSWGLSNRRGQCVFGDDSKPSVFASIRNHLKWVDEEYNKSLAKDGKVNF